MARALDLLRERDDKITAMQVRIAQIPTVDLDDVHRDPTGNVLGRIPGRAAEEPVVVLSGHLDTVFPDIETIRVERDGTVLHAPGIADDAAGLAAVVHIARALREARVPLRRGLVVAGTVGEEGEGDLVGVKGLFAGEYAPHRVAAFLTLDLGTPGQVVNEGLGSRRLLVTVAGPGGHSWGDFGRPNPIHALARAIDDFVSQPLPPGPHSSFNVGVIEGGRGVNVIPERASMRVDLRSESPLVLTHLETTFRASLDSGLAREHAWSGGEMPLQMGIAIIGDRPAGRTPPESPLVRTMVAAFASQSLSILLGTSSTDANWPMSLGTPALALPHGCEGRDAHSVSEWCDVAGRPPVLAAELLAVVAIAGLEGPVRPRRPPTD